MNRLPPAADSADGRINPQVSDDALRNLGDAIARLAGDSDYVIRSLTEMLLTMRPVATDRHSESEVRFLIESGTFTAEEWAKTSAAVDRGSLQRSAAEAWLSHLCATMSLEEVTGYLGWTEDAVRTAIAEGRLYAIEITGRLRFPAWQFNVGSPEKLIPGLPKVIEVVTPRRDWRSIAAFMATPQSSLVAEGRQTPVAWLRDGGDVSDVTQIVEDDDWW